MLNLTVPVLRTTSPGPDPAVGSTENSPATPPAIHVDPTAPVFDAVNANLPADPEELMFAFIQEREVVRMDPADTDPDEASYLPDAVTVVGIAGVGRTERPRSVWPQLQTACCWQEEDSATVATDLQT